MISDLMADECNGERSVWLGVANSTFDKVSFTTGQPFPDPDVTTTTPSTETLLVPAYGQRNLSKIHDPNANAFIDINGDG